MMIKRGLAFDRTKKQQIQRREGLIYAIFLAFIVGPLVMSFMITIPWEPTHALIQDVLEVEVKLQLSHAPFLIIILWFAINIGGVIQLATTMVFATMQITEICISSMSPLKVTQVVSIKRAVEYQIETDLWGSMTDEMIILHVRSLQIINLVTNKIYASVMVTAHHLCCLVIFVGVLYIVITLPQEIIAGGLVAVVFILGAMTFPLILQYLEADLVGKNLQVVETFLMNCKNMTKRRSAFRKTVASVPRIRVELMYPYGSVGKDTFLQFCNNSLDNLIALVNL